MTKDEILKYKWWLIDTTTTRITEEKEIAKSTRHDIAKKALIKIKVNKLMESKAVNKNSDETDKDFFLRISTDVEEHMIAEKEKVIPILTELYYKFILLSHIKEQLKNIRYDLIPELTQNYDNIYKNINDIYEYLKNEYIIHTEEENNIRTDLFNKAIALADENRRDDRVKIIKETETKIKKNDFIKLGYSMLTDQEDDTQFVLRIDTQIKAEAAAEAAAKTAAAAEAEDKKFSILKKRATILNESNTPSTDINLEDDIINYIIELINLYIDYKKQIFIPEHDNPHNITLSDIELKNNIIKIFKQIEKTITILSSKSPMYYTKLLQKLNELLIPIQLYILNDDFINLFLSDKTIFNEINSIKLKNTDYKEKADDMYTKIENFLKHDLEIRNDEIEKKFTQLEEPNKLLVNNIVNDINKYFKIINPIDRPNYDIPYDNTISLIADICTKINRIDDIFLPYIIYYLSIEHKKYRLDIFTYSNIINCIDSIKLVNINIYIEHFKRENNIEDIIKLLEDYKKNPYTKFLIPLSRRWNPINILTVIKENENTTDELVLSYKSKNDKLVEEIKKIYQKRNEADAAEARVKKLEAARAASREAERVNWNRIRT